ncbi:MAG: hypothetical protein LAT64_12035 [Phycisphaerales bacterium]|nr:hypothetical protein [Planctomycetota bacterium]MCH8509482.1 hypothetical protein [Phycisphaerales bacterium]
MRRGRSIRDIQSPSERFRAEHSAWLSYAMLTGRSYPRIPTRRADEGGFDGLRARPGGLARAAEWWRAALARVNDVL